MARPAVLSNTQQNRSSDGDDDFLGVAANPVGTNMSLSFQEVQDNVINYLVFVQTH